MALRLLVTGSAGFVGRELVHRLVRDGHEVVGLDIRPEAHSPRFIQHDLRVPLDLPTERFDACVHLASTGAGFIHNTRDNRLEPSERALSEGVIDLCEQTACRRLVFASSINVFEGAPHFAHAPLTHSGQNSPYARAKADGERAFAAVFADLVVLRPTNIFGKDQTRRHDAYGQSHVIPDLLDKISREPVLEVLGDGSQLRNFVHVSDVARFIARALRLEGRHFLNLRSDITVSIGELAHELLRFRGVDRPIEYRAEYLACENLVIEPFDMTTPRALGFGARIESLQVGLRV